MAALSVSEDQKAGVRATVFHHLSGIALAPVTRALWERGVFELFATSETVALDEVVEKTRGNRGYLRVALRLLASSGWLTQNLNGESGPSYTITPQGRIAFELAPELYGEAIAFLPKAMFLEEFLFKESD